MNGRKMPEERSERQGHQERNYRMNDYIRKVNYHETDKMGITHHSNYIKWMEEARIDFLDQIGFGYAKLEEDGIISPVIGVECQYKHSTTFGDEVRIRAEVEEFRGVKLVIRYTMTNNKTGELVSTGRTMHCFTDTSGRPVTLKRQFPRFDQKLRELAEDAQ
ncbi:MAG: acyl-CoA thioesterase [Fusicatenibacter sp.]|nr:acyl-CoA thioesterase [Fusicatenibacter sp.]